MKPKKAKTKGNEVGKGRNERKEASKSENDPCPGADEIWLDYSRKRPVFGNLWGGAPRASPQKAKMKRNEDSKAKYQLFINFFYHLFFNVVSTFYELFINVYQLFQLLPTFINFLSTCLSTFYQCLSILSTFSTFYHFLINFYQLFKNLYQLFINFFINV